MTQLNRMLILTTAAGYGPEHTHAFRRSLEKVGFKGDIAFLMDDDARQKHAGILHGNMQVIPYTAPVATYRLRPQNRRLKILKRSLYRLLKFPMRLLRAVSPMLAYRLGAKFNFIMLTRNVFYYRYLKKFYKKYDWVVIADVRDAIFQQNPEIVLAGAPFSPDQITVGLETDRETLGSNICNRDWIKRVYGARTARRHASCRISCAGALYGTTAAILDYLDRMCAACTDATYRLYGKHTGYDQGIHNFLLHTGQIPHAVICQNFTSPLANLHGEDTDRIANCLKDGVLLREDTHEPIMLVHQYDRFPDLASQLLDRLNRD